MSSLTAWPPPSQTRSTPAEASGRAGAAAWPGSPAAAGQAEGRRVAGEPGEAGQAESRCVAGEPGEAGQAEGRCAAGRMMISLTSTSGGWATAYAIAPATAPAGMDAAR